MSSRSRRNKRRRQDPDPSVTSVPSGEDASAEEGDVLVLAREDAREDAAADEDEARDAHELPVQGSGSEDLPPAERAADETLRAAEGRSDEVPSTPSDETRVPEAEREDRAHEDGVHTDHTSEDRGSESSSEASERSSSPGDSEALPSETDLGQTTPPGAEALTDAATYPQERTRRGRVRSWERGEHIPTPRSAEAPSREHGISAPRAVASEPRAERETPSISTTSPAPAKSTTPPPAEPASARLRVTRAHLGAAAKTGALLGVVLAVAWGALILGIASVLNSTGAFEPLSEAYATLTGEPSASFLTASATRNFALVSAGFIWAATLCTTLVLAVAYNVISALGGGLEVTVRER